MAETVYVGDVGTEFIFDIGVDSATLINSKLMVLKPDGVSVEWITTPRANSTEMTYKVIVDDLNVPGVYHIQPYIELADWSGSGTKVSLTVEEQL